MGGLTTSKVTNKAGVGVETVRFYYRKGLIKQPSKPASGDVRVYPLITGSPPHQSLATTVLRI